MIADAFIAFGIFVASVVTSIFPPSNGLPTEAMVALQSLYGYVGMLNPLVPVDTLGVILGLYITFELSIFGFKTFRFLFSHVPLVGGKG